MSSQNPSDAAELSALLRRMDQAAPGTKAFTEKLLAQVGGDPAQLASVLEPLVESLQVLHPSVAELIRQDAPKVDALLAPDRARLSRVVSGAETGSAEESASTASWGAVAVLAGALAVGYVVYKVVTAVADKLPDPEPEPEPEPSEPEPAEPEPSS